MRSNYCSCDHSGIAIHSQSELCSRYGFLFNTPFYYSFCSLISLSKSRLFILK